MNDNKNSISEFNSYGVDYEKKYFSNEKTQEFFKSNEYNDPLNTKSSIKKKSNSKKVISIVVAVGTAAITTAAIVNTSFAKPEVNLDSSTFSSLTFSLPSDSNLTNLNAELLLYNTNNIVSAKPINSNTFSFSNLTPSIQYTLNIYRENNLVFNDTYSTLSSPIVKYDNYLSNDTSLCFNVSDINNIDLVATLTDLDNYNYSISFNNDTNLSFTNLDPDKQYYLNIYENDCSIFKSSYNTKGVLQIDDYIFQRNSLSKTQLEIDNPYSYPITLSLYDLNSNELLYSSQSIDGVYIFDSSYFNKYFKATFTYNEQIYYQVDNMYIPFEIYSMSIGATYFSYDVDYYNVFYPGYTFELSIDDNIQNIEIYLDELTLDCTLQYLGIPNNSTVILQCYDSNDNSQKMLLYKEKIQLSPLPKSSNIQIKQIGITNIVLYSNDLNYKDFIISIVDSNTSTEYYNTEYYEQELTLYDLMYNTSYIINILLNDENKTLMQTLTATTKPRPREYSVELVDSSNDSFTFSIDNDGQTFDVYLCNSQYEELDNTSCSTDSVTFYNISSYNETSFIVEFYIESFLVASYQFST